MKSNELKSIRSRSELVPAVSEKNDQSPVRHPISQNFCPKYMDLRDDSGRELDYRAEIDPAIRLFEAAQPPVSNALGTGKDLPR
jgi:hypothetical protein